MSDSDAEFEKFLQEVNLLYAYTLQQTVYTSRSMSNSEPDCSLSIHVMITLADDIEFA